MEVASFLLQLAEDLWGLARKPLGYIRNLKNNVNSLQEETDGLKGRREGVKSQVEHEERALVGQRTPEVGSWLEKVQKFESVVNLVLQQAGEREQIKCVSRCLPQNCRSSYKLGKTVEQLLNQARKLLEEGGKFGNLTSPLPPPSVLAMPMDETVGREIDLKEVLKWLMDKQVKKIGLWGRGGVGKTEIMRRINEELRHLNRGFKVIIWVVVSQQVSQESIQDTLRKRLDIADQSWNQFRWEDRVHHLHHELTRKKFLLLIDDLWEGLDLLSIGVPLFDGENGSKLVFTTRSKDVCAKMGADRTLEVGCLKHEEALKLFERMVGKSLVDFDQEIQELANDVAKECQGLPLALKTVGRAMAGKDHPGDWMHARRTLRDKPHKLSGMAEVYHILEFSYKSLNDTIHQHCFLYCCLYPEDYAIEKDDLIQLWIGEGLLGDTDDVYSMRELGECVLRDLKRICLLESSGASSEESDVKMRRPG